MLREIKGKCKIQTPCCNNACDISWPKIAAI